ncbi:protein FAR1-RELATED SEQUENCE 5-like isoform X2 [Nymphaea colorata]|nr:protein FAR1-RELATED SEQUENCE 5-like isoform X2 [Nymphaea colorata]
MNDAPKSIFACKNFLVNDMNDAPESSVVASDKKDEHDTIFTSSENNIDADTGNTVDSHIPTEGMQFDNEDDAYNFYNDYALGHGFSVRRSSWDKNAQGITVRKTFVCSKEGWKNSSGNPTTRKPDTRCGCPARMVLRRLPNGKYFVRTFICDHNHPLASPSTSHLLRSHRKVTSSRSATSKLANNANIAPKKTYQHLVKVNDDHENVSFTPMDCRNHLRIKRTKTMKNSEICALFDYLQKKSSSDPGFYNTMQLDEDGYVTNVFWADSKSRVDYECFNDVLVFDTTLKINTDHWPFVQFVGVNHHSQSCVFGGAFLSDESIDSFEWLFRVFTEAMNGKHPQVVLTDIDNAIAVAVSHVWPNAHHRLCLWHIFQNAEKCIGHILNQKTGFKESFTRCIFQCEDDDTFRFAWEQMILVYNLEKNLWLQRLYKDKGKWALAYGRQYFCAGMISTQRVESMHATLKKCLYSCLTIFCFMEQYEAFVNGLRQSELEEDIKGFHTRPITLGMKILMQPADLYTPTAFEWLKKEVIEALNCSLEVDTPEANMQRYHVVWEGEEFPKRHEAYVTYNVGNKAVECTCKKYEFKGILCRHALKALDRENIKEIPESYIMRRWTKNAKIRMLNTSCLSGSSVDDKCYVASRYQLMCRSLLHVADLASKNEEAYEYMSKLTNDALKKVYLLHHQSIAAHGNQYEKTKSEGP